MNLSPKVWTLLATFAVALASGSAAHAAEYGSFVISNNTGVDVPYQVKWGDGEWESSCLESGYRKWHYYELDCDGRAPIPHVRFDCVGGDGDYTNECYEMDFYATDCPSEGKPHYFEYSSCGTYLDLYKK